MEEANWSREYDPEETLLAYGIFGDKKINQLTELELIQILEDYGVRYVRGTRDRLASGLVQLLEVTQLWNQPTNESNINIIRCSTIIKLDVLAKGDDPYNWLDYATHYLATLNISDHDRLNVLRRHIPSKLIMWDRELEKNGLTGNYTVYLEQLKKKLLTSEMT